MNSFGRVFRLSIYGESHGPEIGILIDGCPVGIKVSESDFTMDIQRRSPGAIGTTARVEKDTPVFKSGIYNGSTTGSPIMISFANENTISKDYSFDGFFRPGHADFTAFKKSKGYNNPTGSGHFSGRLTLPIVAAGVIAKKTLGYIRISANLIEAGGSTNIESQVANALSENDSIGGVIECRVENMEVSLGEPFFDSLESLISHAMFSIPGLKAIEFGEGVNSVKMKGSEFNDLIINTTGTTATNNSGGINGGISNGNDLYFRLYFKPASSIKKTQKTYNFKSNSIEDFTIEGRHDACYVQRVPVVVEAMTAIVLADLKIISNS